MFVHSLSFSKDFILIRFAVKLECDVEIHTLDETHFHKNLGSLSNSMSVEGLWRGNLRNLKKPAQTQRI